MIAGINNYKTFNNRLVLDHPSFYYLPLSFLNQDGPIAGMVKKRGGSTNDSVICLPLKRRALLRYTVH